MKSFSDLAQSVIYVNEKGIKIKLNDIDPQLELIGEGRSAYAFKVKSTNKVLKVYFPAFHSLAKEEAEIYEILSDTPFYPRLYEIGMNYIVIDYIEGDTLFNCIRKGVEITEKNIEEIDQALEVAKARGLNPSDIHLRNIFLSSGGRIKLIDVARFRQEKQCTQWNDLKKAYIRFYKTRHIPKKIPALILNIIAYFYKKRLFPFF
ncbi:protein kinase family protein [Litchfieldia salsa]|uniref:Predicted Ser/Thr protein kinase n=1 Tax=Litchfieldia salsa TaxID=930152 RepID=A0A1H0RRA2_9BACI|nr:protein kinase family protein [Litchfieldia salsa]SDP31930.1 Predicted Ser/Thr protein kinase [Litchfieldia salsa]